MQDAGSSQLSSSIPVTIYVIRNLQDPVFSQTLYTASLSYLANVGDILTTVTATDADTDVRTLIISDCNVSFRQCENFSHKKADAKISTVSLFITLFLQHKG